MGRIGWKWQTRYQGGGRRVGSSKTRSTNKIGSFLPAQGDLFHPLAGQRSVIARWMLSQPWEMCLSLSPLSRMVTTLIPRMPKSLTDLTGLFLQSLILSGNSRETVAYLVVARLDSWIDLQMMMSLLIFLHVSPALAL
jgi:hypothetical protein